MRSPRDSPAHGSEGHRCQQAFPGKLAARREGRYGVGGSRKERSNHHRLDDEFARRIDEANRIIPRIDVRAVELPGRVRREKAPENWSYIRDRAPPFFLVDEDTRYLITRLPGR